MNDRLHARRGSMPFAMSSVLPDSQFIGLLPGSPLAADLSRMFRELGVQFLRASVVRISSMAFQAAWSISDEGEVNEGPSDRGLDSVFPGASLTIGQIAQAATDDTLAQKLSPRQWAYGWRLDDDSALICEVHYREKRDRVSSMDSAMVRLVCSASLRGSLAAVPVGLDGGAGLAWPTEERRAPSRSARRRGWSLLLAAGAALLAGWLLLGPVPLVQEGLAAQRSELERLNRAANGALVHGLSAALASGDPGEVQAELSRFYALGLFGSAVVVNDRGLVVAADGLLPGVRLGEPLALPLPGPSRTLPLAMALQPQGQLVLTPLQATARGAAAEPPAAVARAALGQIRVGAGVLAVACLMAAALLVWRPRRRPRD